jgi:hypothetical protein
VGDSNSRLTIVEYVGTDGERHRADLADGIADESAGEFAGGTEIEVYAFCDPDLADSVDFLTEAHDEVLRDGTWTNGVRFGQSGNHFAPPRPGSPFLADGVKWKFAEPDKPDEAAASEAKQVKRPQLRRFGARALCVIAWTIAGLAWAITGMSGIGTSTVDVEGGITMFVVSTLVALGAMIADISTSEVRGALSRWALPRFVGIAIGGIGLGELERTLPYGGDPTVGIWECVIGVVLFVMVPIAGGLIRFGTGGATPTRDQRDVRTILAWSLVVPLIVGSVLALGRVNWLVSVTTQPSIGIGIGRVQNFHGTGETHEVVVVPYKVDPFVGSLSARVAAFDLSDGQLLWDEPLHTDAWTGYPVAVTSFEVFDGYDGDVQVSTEYGTYGFDLEYGDLDCEQPAAATNPCFDEGQGTLAFTGEPASDLYGKHATGVALTDTNGVVVDPVTGEPVGDGFTLAYGSNSELQLVVDDQVIDAVDNMQDLRQVLVAPSGRVVLIMREGGSKGTVVIASRTELLTAVVGDRGYVPWPGPFAGNW